MINPIAPTLAAIIAALNCDQSGKSPVALLGREGCICTVTPYPPKSGGQGRIGVLRDDCPARGHGR